MTAQLALSRTCDLQHDFPGCDLAGWQQAMANCAHAVWQAAHPASAGIGWCCNCSGFPFSPPIPAVVTTDPYAPLPADDSLAAIFALSTLNYIEAPMGFLNGRGKCLVRGGLFFLTFRAWDAIGPDCAIDHAQRIRLYDLQSWRKLITEARRSGLRPFGGVDWRYHGHQLGDHTLATLVLLKGERR